jgi:SAM-dependent methyltransferase
MAHREQIEFVERVKSLFPAQFSGARVLEIGSLDINGTVRSVFDRCDYTGVDVAPGKGVDVVCGGEAYDAPDGTFDTVISCECLEHNPEWKGTFRNMVRLCTPDGLVVMSCATLGRPEHGTARSDPDASPLTVAKGWNYYRNLTPRDFVDGGLVEPLGSWAFFENWRAYDLYFVGRREPFDAPVREKLEAIARHYREQSFRTFKGLKRFVKAKYLLRK